MGDNDDHPLPDLPDIDLDDVLPNLDDILPKLPELEDFFGHPPEECPVCRFFEENICRPFAVRGDPHACALELKAVRDATLDRPREERLREVAKVFVKYGIPPDAAAVRRGP